jgi:uncharacterized protein YbaR (Trm112 family)
MEHIDRYEVILHPFVNEITNDYVCEFTCTKCQNKVQSTPRVQAELAVGGVGHHCKNCDTYLALFQCPNCKTSLTVDDEEWQNLAKPEGVNCPHCKANLFREKENWRPKMETSEIMLPGLNSWSGSEEERVYLSKIRRRLDENSKRIFTVRHHSLSVRMKSAKESLDFFNTNEWYAASVISNTPGPVKKEEAYKTPHDHDFHNNLFSFINNLRSALDIFTQEVATFLSIETPESKIDFGIVNRIFSDTTDELSQIVDTFNKSDSYNYLNKLRNVLQHRRIPLMVTVGSHDTSQLDTIRPVSVRSKANIRLPIDPYDSDNLENSSSYGVMLFSKINELYTHVKNFILEIYNKIEP